MRKVTFNGKMVEILLFLTLSLSSFAQTAEQLNGFKEFMFGSSPGKYKNITLELADGNIELYTVNSSNLKIDGISFEYVRLTFNKQKLSAISIQTKNHCGSAFLEKLTKTYGDIKSIKIGKNKQWKNWKMTLIYETLRDAQEANVSFYSNKF